jgi:hypothetical protein
MCRSVIQLFGKHFPIFRIVGRVDAEVDQRNQGAKKSPKKSTLRYLFSGILILV